MIHLETTMHKEKDKSKDCGALVSPVAAKIAPLPSLRERITAEQRRLEKIWRQDPARVWRSR